MTRADLLQFMRGHRWAVQTSVCQSGAPQAALVGVVVTDKLELFFDTLDVTRKVVNLRSNPKIAFVLGGWNDGDERTVQYEGVADEPGGPELDRLKEIYFGRFPDGHDRESWPGLVYVRARPTWIRYSDFNRTPPEIVVFNLAAPVGIDSISTDGLTTYLDSSRKGDVSDLVQATAGRLGSSGQSRRACAGRF